MVRLLTVFVFFVLFFFSSRRRHTRLVSDWSSDVCSSDLGRPHDRRHDGIALREENLLFGGAATAEQDRLVQQDADAERGAPGSGQGVPRKVTQGGVQALQVILERSDLLPRPFREPSRGA